MKKITMLLSVAFILLFNISDAKAETIQDEIARIEGKAYEYEGDISNAETQMEMNLYSGDLYQLWDDELNSIWKRLSKELTPEMKKKVLNQQRAWIKRKDENVKSAGDMVDGGSMQPLVHNSRAAEMTRARVYVLAKYLANNRNEIFIIPSEVKKSINEADPNLNDVFKSFEGQWKIDEKPNTYIGIERTDMCLYGVEGSNWTLWVTDEVVLSDKEVYSYTKDNIIFKVSRNGKNSFYKLSFTYGDTIIFASGSSLDKMDNVITFY